MAPAESTCQLKYQPFCSYSKGRKKLLQTTKTVERLHVECPILSIRPEQYQDYGYYITKCGNFMLALFSNKENRYKGYLNIYRGQTSIFMIPLEIYPHKLVVSPDESLCMVFGRSMQGLCLLSILHLNICTNDPSKRTVYHAKTHVIDTDCKHHTADNAIIMSATILGEMLAVLTDTHLQILHVGSSIQLISDICLKMKLVDMDEISSIVFSKNSTLVCITRTCQCLEYEWSKGNMEVISRSGLHDKQHKMKLFRISPLLRSEEYFCSLSASEGYCCLFKKVDKRQIELVNKLAMADILCDKEAVSFVVDFSVSSVTGSCCIFYRDQRDYCYKVICFNVIDSNIQPFIIDEPSLSIGPTLTHMYLNWENDEVLFIDFEGHLKSFLLPRRHLTLKHLAKDVVLAYHRRENIIDFNIPTNLKVFLSY